MADFDPDKYLAEKLGQAPQAFDPDKYLAEKTAAQSFAGGRAGTELPLGQRLLSDLKAGTRGFVQGGTLGFGDEIGGLEQGYLQNLTNTFARANQRHDPGSGLGTKLMDALGVETRYGPSDLGSTYHGARNENRQLDEEAARNNPGSFLTGSLAGALTTAPLATGLAKGLPLLGNATRAARIGQAAVLGGFAGLGSSNAATPGAMAADASGLAGIERAGADIGEGNKGRALLDLLGAGAAGGVGAAGAAEAAPFLARGLGSRLENSGVQTAKKAIYNVTNGLSARKDIPDRVANAALQSGAIKFFGSAHGNAERLADLAAQEGARLNNSIQTLEGAGVRIPAADVVSALNNQAAQVAPNTLVEQVPRVYSRMGEQVIDKMDPLTDSLGLGQNENLKRSAQGVASSAYNKMRPGEIGAAQKTAASIFRQASEDAVNRARLGVPEGSPVDQAAQDFLESKQRLADLLPARNEAEIGAARGARRSSLGLAGHELLAEGIGSGDPTKAAKNFAGALINSVLHHRGPSTAAVSSYFMGKALRQGASLLDNPVVAGALQRGLLLGEPDPMDVQRAQAEALRGGR